jgi:peptidoglycan hydrolase-like protein with peptidoglycan-binding domain
MPASWEAGEAAPAPAAPAGFAPSGDARCGHAVGSLEWAQTELNALGIPTVPLVVDGIEGSATRAAVRQFQIKAGFLGADVDGIVGPKTIAALEKAA